MSVTNPQAIAFCNNYLRPGGDRGSKLYYFAKAVLNEWNSTGMSTLITTGSGVIRDGASPTDDVGTGGDGRIIITGNDVVVLINQLQSFVTDMEATSNTKLNAYLKCAVNPGI